MQKTDTARTRAKAFVPPLAGKTKTLSRTSSEPKKSLPKTKPDAIAKSNQKTGTISARVNPVLKKKTTAILQDLGLSYSEAITLFLSQIALHRGLPFDVKIPNATTAKSLRNLRENKNIETYASVDALMEAIK